MRQFKKEIMAMILAGGQGSRLKEITHHIAKPAVPFGGKYRIIDFALSNCANSEIDTVGILTQYEPFVLNSHIGIGSPWDLDRQHGGVRVLPPYSNRSGGRWYKGTANAIYENISFIDRYDPEYVLILSGDHIYNMNYAEMLEYHKRKKAEVTIAVKGVSLEEATRFGILSSDESGRIYDFEEKPANPKSTNASMGIYIFNWRLLREALIEDEANPESRNDFGKNIIPRLVADNADVFSYEYEGYWRDVGTVESLWEANMDLLNHRQELDLYNPNWKVYSANTISPPQYIAPTANVERSIVNDGCVIKGNVKNSIISTQVKIGENSVVEASVVMPGAVIEEGVRLYRTVVLSDAVVKDNTIVEGNDEEVIIVSGE